eukprot:sb/3471195/
MSMIPSLKTIKGICILDNDGKRVVSKYYDTTDDTFATVKDQKAFEGKVFKATEKANSEIVAINNYTVVYRSNVDLFFYVFGDSRENELMLLSVLNALYDSISMILRKNVEKRAIFENMDSVLLICDEVADRGILLECDATNIVNRVHPGILRYPEKLQLAQPILRDSVVRVSEVFQSAKEQLKWSLLR